MAVPVQCGPELASEALTISASSTHLEFQRGGVLLLCKAELDGSDCLCSGTLTISKPVPPYIGPIIRWVNDADQREGECGSGSGGGGAGSSSSVGGAVVGSLPERDWDVVSGNVGASVKAASAIRNLRPIEVELCEIKSFRLSDDSNQMTLIQCDGTKHPPIIFLDEGPEPFIDAIKKYVCVKQSFLDENLYLLSDAKMEALDRSLTQMNLLDKTHTDAVYKFVSDFQRDPYSTAMSTFSKIAVRLLFSPAEESRPADDGDDDVADLLQKSLHMGAANLDVTTTQQDDGEFEMVTSRPRIMDQLPALRRRDDPLCQLDWELHWDVDGNICQLDELKQKIFRGGIEHNVRCEVWKYLLNYYDFHMDHSQLAQLRKQKVDEYFQMKCQWRSLTTGQEERFSAFRERKTQIEKDVFRTDRSHPYFQGEHNKNIDLLQDILMTYVMYNFDLGYVQGMSDLLAPIVFVMQNEVDAFWCFVGFMRLMSSNFDFEVGGIKQQLSMLADLLKSVDAHFYSYLDTKESGNLFFCFRWILIWFKREFSFNDTMRLWEVLWSGLPCPNFHLLICLALMHMAKKTIMENKFGFNEILKHFNDMANHIQLNEVLALAEAIYLKMSTSPYISNAARRVIGLPTMTLEHFANAAAANATNSGAPLANNGSGPAGAGRSQPVNIVSNRGASGNAVTYRHHQHHHQAGNATPASSSSVSPPAFATARHHDHPHHHQAAHQQQQRHVSGNSSSSLEVLSEDDHPILASLGPFE